MNLRQLTSEYKEISSHLNRIENPFGSDHELVQECAASFIRGFISALQATGKINSTRQLKLEDEIIEILDKNTPIKTSKQN